MVNDGKCRCVYKYRYNVCVYTIHGSYMGNNTESLHLFTKYYPKVIAIHSSTDQWKTWKGTLQEIWSNYNISPT